VLTSFVRIAFAPIPLTSLGLKAYRFPIEGNDAYVTISQLQAEGTAIGTITLGGQVFSVSITEHALGAQ
jgi:hypothetical protein